MGSQDIQGGQEREDLMDKMAGQDVKVPKERRVNTATITRTKANHTNIRQHSAFRFSGWGFESGCYPHPGFILTLQLPPAFRKNKQTKKTLICVNMPTGPGCTMKSAGKGISSFVTMIGEAVSETAGCIDTSNKSFIHRHCILLLWSCRLERVPRPDRGDSGCPYQR